MRLTESLSKRSLALVNRGRPNTALATRFWATCKGFSWLWVKPEPYADDPYIKSGMMTDRKYLFRLARMRQRRARHRLPIFLAVREMHRSTCGCQVIRSSIKAPRYFALVVCGSTSFRQRTPTSGCCPLLLVKTNTVLFFAFNLIQDHERPANLRGR